MGQRQALRTSARAICLLGALTVACGPSETSAPLIEPGVSWELAQLRKATLSDLRYSYDLNIPARLADSIQGQLRLTFSWDDPQARPVVLDFLEAEQRVRGVRINGRPVDPSLSREHVAVAGEHISPGENTLEVDFIAGDGSLNRNDEYLYTLFVPDRARFALPIVDQPNLKGRFTLRLTLPPDWVAVSNGPERETQSLPGRRTRIDFAETRPIPTYLFAFAAGVWQVEEGIHAGRSFRVFHRETDAEKLARNLPEVFKLHADALDWLEDYTSIAYPFQKFDFVLVPSFQYGGMEHPGAIFYRASGILLDEPTTVPRRLGQAGLIAHETAHIWFGDLVTMNWFDDVWMKEVFANFMAAKIAHPSFPEVDHPLRFLLGHHPSAYSVDRTPGSNAIRQPLENLNEAGTLYGAIIYQKAPVVMKQLERMVGEEAFRDGLRAYLAEHRFANATWRDLVDLLDRRSADDLVGWSSVWVEEPGRPRLISRWEEGGPSPATLAIEQRDPHGENRIWPQRLELIADRGGVRHRAEVWSDAERVVVPEFEGAERPDWLLLNGSGVEYGLFDIDDRSIGVLLTDIQDLQPAMVRGAAWVTLWDAVLESRVPADSVMPALLRLVRFETDEQLLSSALDALSTTFWRYLTVDQRLVWADAVETTLMSRFREDQPPAVRVVAMQALMRTATTADGRRWLEDLFDGLIRPPGGRLSENDRTTLAFELAVREAPDWSGVLDRQADSIRNPDRRRRFAFIRPALDADPAVRRDFFERLLSEQGREQEAWVLTGLHYLHHPLRRAEALDHILPSLELMEEIQRTGDIFFPGRWIETTLGGHNGAHALSTVDAFLEERPDYPERLRRKILQARDGLERAVRITGARPEAVSAPRR